MYKTIFNHLFFTLFLSITFFSKAYALDVPGLTGPVVDLAGVLKRQEAAAISNSLKSYKEKYGPQIQILIIPSLEGDVIENYAIKVVDQWKIGDQKKDDGALLIMAINDRAVRIEVGQGLEGSLTDLETSRIIRQMTPFFKEGRYAQGIVSGLSSMMSIMGGEMENIPLRKEVRKKNIVSNGSTLFFFLIILLLNILGRGRRVRTGFGSRSRGGFYIGSGGGFSGGGGWSGGGGGFSGGGSSGKW